MSRPVTEIIYSLGMNNFYCTLKLFVYVVVFVEVVYATQDYQDYLA